MTTFDDGGATVAITEFADEVVLGGDPFVAVYSRVRVVNPTGHTVTVDPEASPALVPLDPARTPCRLTAPSTTTTSSSPTASAPRTRGRATRPSPAPAASTSTSRTCAPSGTPSWPASRRSTCPTPTLVDAYKSGFITTQLTRSGDALDTGVNGYESEFSHDVVGILTNLFTQGSFTDAQALLTEARNVVGGQGQYAAGFYVDGLWTYSVPWAVYLMKTGDSPSWQQNFATSGPEGAGAQPSIEAAAHAIAADRTGPMGTMEATNDIDTQGYWTTDDYEALLGLAAYRYLAAAVGNTGEAAWATSAVRQPPGGHRRRAGPDHRRQPSRLPALLAGAAEHANRCDDPEDANWTSPFAFGSWAWEGYLLGATVSGPGLTLIDATYDYGFGRLRGVLPPGTTGGFPGDYYSSAYDAAQGAAGLASAHHRDQGIVDYEFMIANGQSGPLSWWESSSAPDPASPWVGRHPAQRPGLVAARLGHGRRQQGPARLAGGAAHRRGVGGGPRRAGLRGWTRLPDFGDQLPHHRRPTGRPHHHVERLVGHPHPARGAPGRCRSSSSSRRSSGTSRRPRPARSTRRPGR